MEKDFIAKQLRVHHRPSVPHNLPKLTTKNDLNESGFDLNDSSYGISKFKNSNLGSQQFLPDLNRM